MSACCSKHQLFVECDEDVVCQVCFERPAVLVEHSKFGPFFFGRCEQCIKQDAEPKWVLDFVLSVCGGSGRFDPAVPLISFVEGKYINARVEACGHYAN